MKSWMPAIKGMLGYCPKANRCGVTRAKDGDPSWLDWATGRCPGCGRKP